MVELWKSISGYEGLYEVSNLGMENAKHFLFTDWLLKHSFQRLKEKM